MRHMLPRRGLLAAAALQNSSDDDIVITTNPTLRDHDTTDRTAHRPAPKPRTRAAQGRSGSTAWLTTLAILCLSLVVSISSATAQSDQLSLEELKTLAEGGDPESQYQLGVRHQTGAGVAPNLFKAGGWFTKAAEQGHAGAQNNLGSMHMNGIGLPKDYAKALDWFGKAAEQGDRAAQNNLGNCSPPCVRL